MTEINKTKIILLFKYNEHYVYFSTFLLFYFEDSDEWTVMRPGADHKIRKKPSRQ